MRSIVLSFVLLISGIALAQDSTENYRAYEEFTVYKFGSSKAKKLGNYKLVNLEMKAIDDTVKNCSMYTNYQGRMVGRDSNTVTFEYFVKDVSEVCETYEESYLLEALDNEYNQSITVPISTVNALWYEPKSKVAFANIGKICAFTGLLVAPLVSIQKDGGFDTKKYFPIVGASAIGAGLSFGLYFLVEDKSFSLLPAQKGRKYKFD